MIVQLRLRGAFILALGFGLGYAKAVHDTDEIRDLLQDLLEELKHFPPDPVPENEDGEAEEIVDAIEEVSEPAKEKQGEPS